MRKTGVIFPGQGTQCVGMGQPLVERYKFVRELYDCANDILGYDLYELCKNGPIDRLTESKYCQPALFVHQFALAKILEISGKCESINLAMGLSIGSLTALTFAGVFDFETGVKIVKKRGEAIQEACESTRGGMASILGASMESVRKLCVECGVEMSNVNCEGQIIVSGEISRVKDAVARCAEITNGKAIMLNVAGAFHSSFMESARLKFEVFLEKFLLKQPKIDFVSNVTGEIVNDSLKIKEFLVKQIISPVLWLKCMETAMELGVMQFFQCGSGRTLINMGKRISSDILILPFGDAEI